MQNPGSQPKCCGHCLHDLPCALTYELCDTTRRNQVDEPYQPWWPASIDSPTLYFHLKRRAMEHQFREQARLGHYSDPSVWRAPHTSATAGAANLLLARRGKRQLSLRLPAGRTNVDARDELEFVGVRSLEAAAPMPAPMPLPAAPLMQQQAQQQQEVLAARQKQQAAAAQQAQQQQHTVVRPRARRPVPLPPAAAPVAPPPVLLQPLLQQLVPTSQQQQQQQQQMGLLASLQLHEQRHRQQLAAAAWGSAFVAVEAAHPASFLRPQWQLQDCWEAEQPLAESAAAQQQQQQQTAASWPFGVPQQQQGCWAYAASLAPHPSQPAALMPLQAGQPALATLAC